MITAPLTADQERAEDQLLYAARKMVQTGRRARTKASRERYMQAAANLRFMASLVRSGGATIEAADDWIDAAASVLKGTP